MMKQAIKGLLIGSIILCTSVVLFAESQSIVKMGAPVYVSKGTVVKEAISIGGNVFFNGTSEEDVVSIGGSVFLGPSAVVKGDVVSVGGKIVKQPAAAISANVVEMNLPLINSIVTGGCHINWPIFLLITGFIICLGFLVLIGVITALMPQTIQKIADKIESRPGKTFLWGIVGCVLIVPVALLLLISIIGIVFIPLWLIAVAGAFLVGFIAISQLIMHRILVLCKWQASLLFETLLGVIILGLLFSIPFIGWLIKIIVLTFGIGGVIQILLKK